jgi:hypothetical protein
VSAAQPQPESKPTELARGAVILCGCPRVVRRPYDLPAMWLGGLELPALRAEGTIAVWHRPECTR